MKNELFLKYSGTNFNGGNIMANTRVRNKNDHLQTH